MIPLLDLCRSETQSIGNLGCFSSFPFTIPRVYALYPSSIQEGESAPEQNKRSPSDFLKAVLGRPVNVRLNSGTDYRGK